MKETSKAMNRRRLEEADGGLPWSKILSGKGLDIGSGDDLLPGAEPFDKEHGDANDILKHRPQGVYDYIHCSHVVEHLDSPRLALDDWIKLLKVGGYIVGEVPSWELYEGKRPTSVWNPDHRSTWSTITRKGGGVLPHYYAPEFFHCIGDFLNHQMEVVQVRLVDTNYDYCVGASVDQTFDFSKSVECYIEFILKKKF